MITPAIDGDTELAAKLDRLPAAVEAAIRAALAAESDRLGRVRHRFRPPGGRTAGVPPALLAAIEAAIQQALQP